MSETLHIGASRVPRGVGLTVCWAVIVALVGCATSRYLTWMPLYTPPCALSDDVSLAQTVAFLNRSVVPAWRSTDVRITARQAGMLPVSLSAVLAAREPHNLRLIATNSFGGNEVDLGSNNERFWLWLRRAEPKCLLTAAYDELPRAQQRLRVPFQPDWLMATLGVVRLDESQYSLERPTGKSHLVQLVTHQASLQGESLRKVTTVDTCRGVVLEHRLYDARGSLIAKAAFADHRKDAMSGAVFPHRIDLEWPETALRLSMQIGHIEVNPIGVSKSIWELPAYPDSPTVDLTR